MKLKIDNLTIETIEVTPYREYDVIIDGTRININIQQGNNYKCIVNIGDYTEYDSRPISASNYSMLMMDDIIATYKEYIMSNSRKAQHLYLQGVDR